MRRLLPVLALAAAFVLVSGPVPRPASADLLPSPLPTLTLPPLPLPLPTLPPVPVPVPSLPVPVPTLPILPLHPSQSGQPAPAPVGGAGAGTGGAAAASAPATSASASPPPPASEPLPPEPQRFAMEAQQAALRESALPLDEQDSAAAQAVGGGDGRFIWPIVFAGRPPITQRFGCTDVPGEQYSPDCATHRFHTGIDLAARMGTPVYAAASGVAHVYRSDSGYGNHVLIAHGSGWFTLYAHLSQILVSDGEAVHRGDPIGEVGSTGFSTGPHLHFETRFGEQPLDPCVPLQC